MTGAEEVNLGELLSALTVEVRALSAQFRRSRTSRAVQWVISAGLIVAIAVSGYSIVGINQVAHCINSNLGIRSAPSAALTSAQLTYASAQLSAASAQAESTRAQNTASAALFVLLKAPKAEQAADYQKFLAAFADGQAVAARTQTAQQVYVSATATYVTALVAVKNTQTANPLGKC